MVASVQVACLACGSDFIAREIDIRRGLGKFCSRECSSSEQREAGRLRFMEFWAGTAYDYTNAKYVNSKTKVEINCLEHGTFWQTPEHHMEGHGCPKCGYKIASTKLQGARKSLADFIASAIAKHGQLYDYSKSTYLGCYGPIEIVCPIHGSFWQKPNNHLSGTGCPKCAKTIGDYRRSSIAEFTKRARQIHGYIYDYHSVDYRTATTPVTVICQLHGPFDQLPFVHLKGSGCPKCSHRISKQETAWLDSLYLDCLYRQHSLRIEGGRRRQVDGYHPPTNTVYQFHGDYFHGNPRVFRRCGWNVICKKFFGELYDSTRNFDQAIIHSGYNLVTMWEYDWLRNPLSA